MSLAGKPRFPGRFPLFLALVAFAPACATWEPASEEPAALVGADRMALIDAAHAAFTEVFGGATRDDASGTVVHVTPDPWITGYSLVRATATVTPEGERFRLTIRCHRLFVEDEQRARMGRSFRQMEDNLDGDLGDGEDAPELETRLCDEAKRWLGLASTSTRGARSR